ncbi:MAG: hypothetical protein AB1716_15000 [Planctomycetota bacterium]
MASSPARDRPATPPRNRAPCAATAGARLRAALAGTSARYWLCLVLLTASAVGLSGAKRAFGWFFRKEPLPIKKPLKQFDFDQLAPRYRLNTVLTDREPPMSEDTLASLGTSEYLSVYLDDLQAPPASTARVARLFVTYYENADKVPHVPEECYLAGGYNVVSDTTERIPLAAPAEPAGGLPVRVLEFQAGRQGAAGDLATVVYFFHTNGDYALTRNDVRRRMLNPLIRYGYYAKIELSFTSNGLRHASRADTLAAVGPLLEQVMPVLLNDHIDLDRYAPAPGGTPIER